MDTKSVLARNIKALMERHPDFKTPRKLAPHCSTATRKIGARTIAHLLDPKSSVQPQLDTIVAIAQAFKVKAWMLLNTEFDPTSKTVAGLPPPEIIELAWRIMRNREALSEVFSSNPVAESKLDTNGGNARALNESAEQDFKKTSRSLTVKLGK